MVVSKILLICLIGGTKHSIDLFKLVESETPWN